MNIQVLFIFSIFYQFISIGGGKSILDQINEPRFVPLQSTSVPIYTEVLSTIKPNSEPIAFPIFKPIFIPIAEIINENPASQAIPHSHCKLKKR